LQVATIRRRLAAGNSFVLNNSEFVILQEMKQKQDREAFKAAYASLNTEQKNAVDSIEGPVMVVAGPGTGKTQILTLRIANILIQTDTSPESILALTFTESGAKAMRERLRRYIGSTAYQVPIYTFHGFAEQLISRYPDSYHRVIGGRPANELEKITLLESILDNPEIKLLRPMGNPQYYVTHILRIIGQLKQEYITPDAFVDIIAQQEVELQGIEQIHEKGAHKGKVRGEYSKMEKSVDRNRELLLVYRQYEALLSEQKLYDFDDMIVETVKALTADEEMLRDLQEQYQYILADEHQDVNGSQNKILELLVAFHQSPNIFAVGDEKQAIYRFQGASLENFLYFTEQFPGTKVISLTQNYRSGQPILDAAHSLVEVVTDGALKDLRVPLEAKAVDGASVTKRTFVHQAVEDSWLTQEIQAQLAAGVEQKEIAVIVRTNKEVETVSSFLRKAGFPVTASADGDILQHPITQAVHGLINVVITEKNEQALFTVLHGAYWGISISDLVKILSARSYDASLWSILSDRTMLESLCVEDIDSVQKVVSVVEAAREKEVHEAPHRVLEYVLQHSGFLTHLMKHDPFEGTRVLRRLYDEIEELVVRDGVGTLREVSKTFTTLQSYRLRLNAPFIETNDQAIQVMTAHKSKGLEFSAVFVLHVTDGAWSGAGKKTYFDIPLQTHMEVEKSAFIEDERRLLYVAMTRAKHALFLSLSETNADGKELVEARLLDDIEQGLIEIKSTEKENAHFDPLQSIAMEAKSIAIDAGLLTHLLAERGFSATSLNNYLRSPWDYFYRNVLRIPETQAVPMQFGTAVHNTLEYVTAFHTKQKMLPNTAEIKRTFEQELRRLPIGVEEYTRLHEKGFTALLSYIDHLKIELPEETKEELKLRVHLETGIPELPEVILTGKLDRIDLTEGKAFRVVDYKTGKPKSRNVIEGNTKSSDGGYKRQLVFYALLLALHDDERYQCRTGVLSFVEPNAKGMIVEEPFTITDEEIEDLKKEIIAATQAIITGEFLSHPCDTNTSEYCQFVEQLKR
jgi:DNA helicase-2/ATP-dependent DNA helicase PcrA